MITLPVQDGHYAAFEHIAEMQFLGEGFTATGHHISVPGNVEMRPGERALLKRRRTGEIKSRHFYLRMFSGFFPDGSKGRVELRSFIKAVIATVQIRHTG